MSTSTSPHHSSLPPGPPSLPVVGHLPQLTINPLGFLRALAYTYGPVASYYVGSQHAVFLSRPEGVREVMLGQAKYLTVVEFTHVMRPLVGYSMFTTEGEAHKYHRHLVQPAFTQRRVESHRDTMIGHIERLVSTWRPGQTVDMAVEMQKVTLGTVAEILCGIEEYRQAERLADTIAAVSRHSKLRNSVLVIQQAIGKVLQAMPSSTEREPGDMIVELCRGPLARIPGTPLHRVKAARDAADEILGTIIRERRVSGVDKGDILSDLITLSAQDPAIDDEAIQNQLVTLLAAGFSTTANTLIWAFYLLSQNPRAAAKLRAELRRVLGNRPPDVADLEHLPYLDHVWSETLRLYPPGWNTSRITHKELVIGGHTLVPGTMLTISPCITQRLPELFKHPNAFWPERFDPQSGEKYDPYAYVPFGKGSRACLGAIFARFEGRLTLATILQHFDPQLVPGFPVYPVPLGVLRPAHGVLMTVKPAA